MSGCFNHESSQIFLDGGGAETTSHEIWASVVDFVVVRQLKFAELEISQIYFKHTVLPSSGCLQSMS